MFFSSYFNKGEKEGENELTEEAVIVLLVIFFPQFFAMQPPLQQTCLNGCIG